jgi:TM2 domain-containing membrane protein YozV
VKKMVNPIIAAIISFIIPGLGQIIAGESKKGIILLIIAIVLYALFFVAGSLISILSLILSIYAAYDAYQIASA